MNKIFYNGSQWMAYPMPAINKIKGAAGHVIMLANQEAKAAALPVLNYEVIVPSLLKSRTSENEYDWPGEIEKRSDWNMKEEYTPGYILSLPSSAHVEKEENFTRRDVKNLMESVRVPMQEQIENLKKIYIDTETNCVELQEENARLRSLIEKAFVSGRSRTSWEQFKKDNNL